MILNVRLGKEWRYAEGEGDVPGLVAEIIGNLKYEDKSQRWLSPGDCADLCFAKHRIARKGYLGEADKFLRVAVNRTTGYGGLLWFAGDDTQAWVSDNPNPPEFDPRVVADPWYPFFHDPGSTLPLDQFRAAVEEYCYSGTGERPSSVQWVRGDLIGRRADRIYPDEDVNREIANPWQCGNG